MEKTYQNKQIDDAILFAVQAFAGKLRKGCELPAIIHSMETAAIAATLTEDTSIHQHGLHNANEVIVAALLHDTVKRKLATKEQLAAAFGDAVAELVCADDVENIRDDLPPEATWRLRKQEKLRYLENCEDIRSKVIVFSDKLANLRSLYSDYVSIGGRVWERFHSQNPRMQGWYYEGVLKACPELSRTAAYQEYQDLLAKNFFRA